MIMLQVVNSDHVLQHHAATLWQVLIAQLKSSKVNYMLVSMTA